jgi:hypothetical protein
VQKCSGVGGESLVRTALNISLEHNGHTVMIPEVFEYDKWVLEYPWFKHYAISINMKETPPFACSPLYDVD